MAPTADERGWVWQMEVLRRQFPGLPLTSGYRPGAITATGNRSYHSRGRAVDVPPRMDVFEWIRANYGSTTKELVYSPAGNRQINNGKPHVYTGITRAQHFDHVHWAIESQTGGAGPNIQTAGLPNPVDVISETVQLAQGIGKFVAFITDPGNWLRMGAGVAGLVLMLLAFLSLTKRPLDFTKVVASVR